MHDAMLPLSHLQTADNDNRRTQAVFQTCFPYLAEGGLAEVGRADGGLYGLIGTRSPGIPLAAIA